MVSVIIITYNRARLLKRCLDSLLAQAAAGAAEIIVVNNGSTDNTAELLGNEYCGRIKLIDTAPKSLSACKQMAFDESRADTVVFLDDDCVPKEGWLELIKKSCRTYDILGGAVLAEEGTEFPRWWRSSLNWLIGINPDPGFSYLPLGSNIVFNRKVLEKINPMLKSSVSVTIGPLPYAEDYLRVRLALACGFSIGFIKEVAVFHYVPAQRLKIGYLIKRSCYEGTARARVERSIPLLLRSFLGIFYNPVLLLLSADINRLFRFLASASYILSYHRKR